MKKTLIKFIPFAFSLFIILSAIEFTVRNFILTKEVLWYEVNTNKFPFFRLKASLDENGTTIRNHRREKYERGTRKENIAFIGDSVTFCVWMPDDECFVEQFQKLQNRFDVYNYGVPGYGLPEFLASIDEALEKNPKYVVYTVNYNDFFDAMPVTYSLLQDPKHRISSWDDYSDDTKTTLKSFVKNHYKTPFALKYYASTFGIFDFFIKRSPSSVPTNTPVIPTNEKTSADCVRNMDMNVAGNYYFEKTDYFYSQLVKDREKLKEISNRFKELKKKVEGKGSKLITQIHHEYTFLSKNNQTMDRALKQIFQDQGIDYLDTWPLYEKHFKECRFYIENDFHLADKGNTYLAHFINESLRNWK